VILFENSGGTTCKLFGYPGVAGLDSQGNQVTQAVRVPNQPLNTVVLSPGATASALVQGSDVPTGTATSCATYAALLVTPPNATVSVKVAASLPGCAGLRVNPVVSGSTGGSS
jgi:hypothetical protein